MDEDILGKVGSWKGVGWLKIKCLKLWN